MNYEGDAAVAVQRSKDSGVQRVCLRCLKAHFIDDTCAAALTCDDGLVVIADPFFSHEWDHEDEYWT